MRADIEHRARRAERAARAELHHRDHAVSERVDEILDEHERAPLVFKRERVCVEAAAIVGQILPARLRVCAQIDHVGPFNVAPTDAPVRRVVAKTIELSRGRAGERFRGEARDICGAERGRRRGALELRIRAVERRDNQRRGARQNVAIRKRQDAAGLGARMPARENGAGRIDDRNDGHA